MYDGSCFGKRSSSFTGRKRIKRRNVDTVIDRRFEKREKNIICNQYIEQWRGGKGAAYIVAVSESKKV